MYGANDKVIPTEPVPIARPAVYESQARQNINIPSTDNRMVIFKPKNVQVKEDSHQDKNGNQGRAFGEASPVQDSCVTQATTVT
jgi:hypothetical protein